MDEKARIAQELYDCMPKDAHYGYGMQYDTEEWRFCEAIAEQMLSICVRVAQLAAEETVKRMREEAKADAIPDADDWADDFDPERLAELADDAAEAAIGGR